MGERDIHGLQDPVDNIARTSRNEGKINHTGRPVHAGITSRGFKADKGFGTSDSHDKCRDTLFECWILLAEDLHYNRGLIVLNEGVVLRPDRAGESLEYRKMGIH